MGFLSALTPFLGPVLGLAGSFIAGKATQKGAEQRNEMQIEQAREQMDFQERMSNTAHQREITDLQAAGLNPILSAKYGGASTPGGAQAQIVDEMGPAVQSAQAARRLSADLKNINADIKNKETTNKNLDATRELTLEQRFATQDKRRMDQVTTERLEIQKQLDQATIRNMGVTTENQVTTGKGLKAMLEGLMNEQDIDKTAYGKIMRYIKRATGSGGAAKAFIPHMRR